MLGWSLSGLLLGLVAGSFIATLVVRWPLGLSVMTGRSRCDGCGTTIGAADLIPIWSFVRLERRARCCGAKIDAIHPFIECAAGLIGLISFSLFEYQGWIAAIFGWLLLAIAALDAKHFWLPDKLTGLIAIAGLASVIAFPEPLLSDRLIGLIGGWAALSVIAVLYRVWRKRDGLGGGDPKLFGAIGAWIGWSALPLVLLAASVAGLVGILFIQLRSKSVTVTIRTRLPLGALLAGSTWPIWLWVNYR